MVKRIRHETPIRDISYTEAVFDINNWVMRHLVTAPRLQSYSNSRQCTHKLCSWMEPMVKVRASYCMKS